MDIKLEYVILKIESYINYFNKIKQELVNNVINIKVKDHSINRSDLGIYYNVGKLLSETGKNIKS